MVWGRIQVFPGSLAINILLNLIPTSIFNCFTRSLMYFLRAVVGILNLEYTVFLNDSFSLEA